MASIKFGTDGWRAVVGKDFNFENVETVTNAIGKYIFDNFGINKKILIGYDPRNMAKEFAFQCAEFLAQIGFEVLISDKILPTPVLAYNAQFLNACAIMFTASHNPPKYLGMKFIPDYAGPATSEITDEIVSNFGQKISKGKEKGQITEFDFKSDYFKHLKTLIDFEKIKTLKTNIIFDGLYSAAIGYFDKFLDEYSIPYQVIHLEFDTNFGGGMPEPKPKYLKELIEQVKLKKNAIGLSNDGDADRFGVINENGQWVSPNEIIAILLLYLKKEKKLEGSLIKTVGASLLLDKVAEKIGVEVIETAVGFKHVGEAMRMFNPIIGGEESGGLSIQGHIPEKDGILANLLVLEAMAHKKKSLVELQAELYDLVGAKFFNERIDLKLENELQMKISLQNAKLLEQINGFKVIKTDLKDGVKLYLDDNSSWILIRPSGTEPLLRIYFESDNSAKIDRLKEFINKNLLIC
jgi:phosphomannomutase